MEDGKVLIKGTMRCVCILLLCVCGSSTTTVDTRCTIPQLHSPWPTLSVYVQETPTLNVAVFSCQYVEKNFCNKPPCVACQRGSQQYTPYTTSNYSDVSNNCLKAFKANKFRNRYGYLHNISAYPLPVTPQSNDLIGERESTIRTREECGGDTFIERTITVTLKRYETQADVTHDEIVLESGSVCKYSLGFCHDERRNADVMWRATNDMGIRCDQLRAVPVSDAYYFILSLKRYALIHAERGYSALELKNPKSRCGTIMWESYREGFVVSERSIEGVQSFHGSLPETAFFVEKQQLYEVLVGECKDQLQGSNSTTREDKDVENLLAPSDTRSSNGLNAEDRFHLRICYYLSMANTLCFGSVVLFLIYSSFKKISCAVDCTVGDCGSSKSAGYGSDVYETI